MEWGRSLVTATQAGKHQHSNLFTILNDLQKSGAPEWNIYSYNLSNFIAVIFNRIIASVFILVFLCQIFSGTFILVDFYVNQKFIAKTSCENRNQPVMHCNGKCQLKRKLSQEQNKDQQNPERKNLNHNEIVSLTPSYFFMNGPYSSGAQKRYFNHNTGFSIERASDFFHPPPHSLI